MTRPILLHIGVSKSGTSALQVACRLSAKRLAEVGLGQPLGGRGSANKLLLAPLGWRPDEGFTGPVRPRALQRLGAVLAKTPGDRLFLSCEDLADAPPAAVEALAEVLRAAELEPRVIVTARSWGRQLPAEYQQFLKVQLTRTYDEFLDDVRADAPGVGRRFRERQQLSRIVGIWSPISRGGLVDVVAVPPYSADATFVYRQMSELLGVAPSDLQDGGKEVNGSFGVVEIELLRRLNATVEPRLESPAEYGPAVRRILVRQTINRGVSARLTLPPEHLDWVRAVAEEELALLDKGGHPVHGDRARLLPDDSEVAAPPVVTDAELAAAAITTLADFALRTRRAARRRGDVSADDPDVETPAPGLAGRLKRKVRG